MSGPSSGGSLFNIFVVLCFGLTLDPISVYVACDQDYTHWSADVRQTMEQIDVTKRMIKMYPEV